MLRVFVINGTDAIEVCIVWQRERDLLLELITQLEYFVRVKEIAAIVVNAVPVTIHGTQHGRHIRILEHLIDEIVGDDAARVTRVDLDVLFEVGRYYWKQDMEVLQLTLMSSQTLYEASSARRAQTSCDSSTSV